MKRGPLGFPRLTDIGPLTFSQKVRGSKAIEETVLDIIEEEDIDTSDIDEEDINFIVRELSERIYPDGGEEIIIGNSRTNEHTIFTFCMSSDWARDWSVGFTRSTTEISSPIEDIIMKANGCVGITEARALRVIELV